MQRIVITGVTSGFGQQWLYNLDTQGAFQGAVEFFVLARNRRKFDAMVKHRPLKNRVNFVSCDLSSLQAIHAAADQIHRLVGHIDLLINNAGHWSTENYTETEDGIESTLAVNQIAPFVLTGRLLPLLAAANKASIVNTASFRHKDARVDRADIQLKAAFDAEQAYCNSKLYCVLFTQMLAEKLVGSHVTVNCFDPGIVDTPMLKQAFPKNLRFLYPLVKRFIAQSPDKGAETGVYLSTSPACIDVTGQYYKDRKQVGISKQAQDRSLGKWLWTESERLSGYKLPQIGQ